MKSNANITTVFNLTVELTLRLLSQRNLSDGVTNKFVRENIDFLPKRPLYSHELIEDS